MNSSTNSNRALKRVLRDLAEVAAEPVPGISLCMPDQTDPFTLHANLIINDGLYQGLLIHLLIHIPQDYPINPPAVNIAPGLMFGSRFHEHIFDDSLYGNSICTDITSNFSGYFKTIDASGKSVKSGWTSAYTLASVLLQLQVFFADPDLPAHALPSSQEIAKLRAHIEKYSLDVRVNDGNHAITVTHSYNTPYPPIETYQDKKIIEEDEEAISSVSSTVDQSSSPSVSDKEEPQKVTQKTVSFDWNKPLKKVSKEDKPPQTFNSSTVVVRVIKPALPDNQDAHDAQIPKRKDRKSFFNNKNNTFKDIKKNQPKTTQAPKNTPHKNIPKPQIQPKPIEEVKEEVIEEPPRNLGDWANPSTLKKPATNPSKITTGIKLSQTQTVTVTKGLQASQTTTQNPTPVVVSSYASLSDRVRLQEACVIFNEECFFKPDSLTPQQIKREVANKLICSVTKVNVFDESKPILGYPIDMEVDAFGRYWPTPIMEILSYDAFVMNIQQEYEKLDRYHSVKFTSSFGSLYNYWMPVYIDAEHFERSKQHIFNAISIISAGVQGTEQNDFKPEMILKVLPPILVKTAIHFLKGTIYQSLVGIDTYCQIYHLFVELIKLFPELQEKIDQEVAAFCSREENRHKRVAGDLGEFLIKLSLSSKGLKDPKIMNLVMQEHLCRQVSWAFKKDWTLKRQQQGADFVKRFMNATEISNQFFLTKLETAKLLLNKEVQDDTGKRCGLLNDETMKLFRARLNWIQKNIKSDWKAVIESIGQTGYVYTEEIMASYLNNAKRMAAYKGYLD